MPLPVVTIAQMRQWEQKTWDTGVFPETVMRRAGFAVAKKATELTRPGDSILLLAGSGNNGNDTRFAAEHLSDRDIRLLNIIDPASAIEEVRIQLAAKPLLLVDGLFGIGLNRALSSDWQKLIGMINSSGIPVLSVDVPSGLNADNGEAMGAAVHATVTLTLGAPKVGLLKSSAAPSVGRLEVASEIGLVGTKPESDLSWVQPADFTGFPPRRAVESHKGDFGHLVIIAGTKGFHGAAVLAARAASRAQPGLVSLIVPENIYVPVASQLQSTMVHVWNMDSQKLMNRATAILAGPGLVSEMIDPGLRECVVDLWLNSTVPVIWDASALDWLPENAPPNGALRVLTPHPGEAARILGKSIVDIQTNREESLLKISERAGGVWVILKGRHSLIGRVGDKVHVNSTGNPQLAQGGSGDVLAGFLGGFLAQPELMRDPSTVLRYGVWRHGQMADDLAGQNRGWGIEDLVRFI